VGKKGDRILKGLPATSHIQRRTAKNIAAAALDTPEQVAYQHSVLCQTSLPYRNPGLEIRVWEKRQGCVSLSIEAGRAEDPKTGEWVQLGLPFGTKPRLILAYLNAEALKSGSREINVEGSLTSFAKRVQKRAPTGPEITAYKEQLSRIAAATIRLAMSMEDRAFQINSQIVMAFNMLLTKDEHQRVLWPATLHLSHDYFVSLQNHAVPLDERALAGLAHSAMALDVYVWLAQRLHRVPRHQPQFIAWATLKDQFGAGLGRMNNFKRYFRIALGQVLAFYPSAKVEGDGRGMTLFNSPPPVKKRLAFCG